MAGLATPTAVRRTPQRGIPGLNPTANPYETPAQAHGIGGSGAGSGIALPAKGTPSTTITPGMVNNIDPNTGRAISPAIPAQAPPRPTPMYDMTPQATPPTDYSLVSGSPGAQPISTGQDLVTGSIQSILDQLRTPTPAREPAPADEPHVSGPNVAPYKGPTLAFSRAKDASSRIHGKALSALKDQMTSRGISGSGLEGQLTGEALTGAASYQSGADLAQALASDERGWDAEKLRYSGDLTQRGQDLGLNTSTTGFGVNQRGQDINVGQGNSQIGLALAQLLARQNRY